MSLDWIFLETGDEKSIVFFCNKFTVYLALYFLLRVNNSQKSSVTLLIKSSFIKTSKRYSCARHWVQDLVSFDYFKYHIVYCAVPK